MARGEWWVWILKYVCLLFFLLQCFLRESESLRITFFWKIRRAYVLPAYKRGGRTKYTNKQHERKGMHKRNSRREPTGHGDSLVCAVPILRGILGNEILHRLLPRGRPTLAFGFSSFPSGSLSAPGAGGGASSRFVSRLDDRYFQRTRGR